MQVSTIPDLPRCIQNKRDMYELYNRGHFGNRLRTWNSLEEFFASDYEGQVSLRYRGPLPGGLGLYGVERREVACLVERAEVVTREKGLSFDRSLVMLNEAAPDDRLMIQGEVQRTPELGVYLRHSFVKTRMRIAMEEPLHATGLRALILLRTYLDPNSYEDVQELLDIYDGHVVEFSTYEMTIGDCPRRNTIVWECRGY